MLDQMVPDSGRAGRDMSVTGFGIDATRVRCPMLLVAADDDRFIPKRIGDGRASLPRARPYVHQHGHMNILEPGWEQLADHIERWIAKQAN